MKLPNYAAEGRIKETAAAAGVRVECLDDVVERFRDGQFNEAELPAKIEEWRATPDHHFFAASGADMIDEARAAFGEERTLTAQGAFVRKHGEAKAAEVAEQFGTSLGGKPGKTPDTFKAKKSDPNAGLPKGSTNPWSADLWSITRQGQVAKADFALAQRLARAAGSYIGATRPTRAA